MLYRILLFLLPLGLSAQQTAEINIIPQPVSVTPLPGRFQLNPSTTIIYPAGEPGWSVPAEYLQNMAIAATGYKIALKTDLKSPKKGRLIVFLADPEVESDEGYILQVRTEQVLIRARTAAGAFYAVQSLRQLFPPEFGAFTKPAAADWSAPCCNIADYPRFVYRGMHLDVGRHFFPVEFIKRYIDLLAMHKMNRFHWHLTEDQGWRIEIKKYPELQKTASCRSETLVGRYGENPPKYDGKPYCGFYTQDEIREVVAYAQARFVTIVPEIEMPGHSQAALSAYPNLGCTGGPYSAATTWGVFEDVFCAGNEQTFQFLDDVLTEVCALFPGEYIHIGGDECPKDRWKVCPKCQKRIADEGLHDEHELQSYFIRRIEAILAQKGKKLIGWDEILEGGLAPNATVMSWRGIEGGIAAAQSGHDAIMTPGSHCYFDHYQSDPMSEPLAIGGFLPLDKVYSYEPVPENLTPEAASHILGAQGNLWTEYIADPDFAEYMAYPRAVALAEVVWSAKEQRDWADFSRRLRVHFTRLDALGVRYGKGFYDLKCSFSEGLVHLSAAQPDVDIRYSLDGMEPFPGSLLYQRPFALTRSSVVKAAAFSGQKKLGNTLTVAFNLHLASGKPYILSQTPDKYNGGTEYALTNAELGNTRSRNKWVGLQGFDIDPTIDLGTETPVKSVRLNFMNAKGSWIYPPRRVEVLLSGDGQNFRSVATTPVDADALVGNSREAVLLNLPTGAAARFVKVVVQNYGTIPAGAEGGGNPAWLFVDEIIVR